MTVSELIAELSTLPKDAQVIIQKDGEGNDYSPLFCVDGDAIYVPEASWRGEVYSTKWSAEDADLEPEEWDKLKRLPRCCVLAPIN